MVGYRWNLGAFLVEAGAGAGGYRKRLPQAGMTGMSGMVDAGKASYGLIPDGVIGVGADLPSFPRLKTRFDAPGGDRGLDDRAPARC